MINITKTILPRPERKWNENRSTNSLLSLQNTTYTHDR